MRHRNFHQMAPKKSTTIAAAAAAAAATAAAAPARRIAVISTAGPRRGDRRRQQQRREISTEEIIRRPTILAAVIARALLEVIMATPLPEERATGQELLREVTEQLGQHEECWEEPEDWPAPTSVLLYNLDLLGRVQEALQRAADGRAGRLADRVTARAAGAVKIIIRERRCPACHQSL